MIDIDVLIKNLQKCKKNTQRPQRVLLLPRAASGKVYGKCFSGVQLVDWLVETMDDDKLEYVTKVWC